MILEIKVHVKGIVSRNAFFSKRGEVTFMQSFWPPHD